MSRSDLAAWLRLTNVRGLGGRTLRKLLKTFGSPDQVLGASHATLTRAIGEPLASAIGKDPNDALIARTLDWSECPKQAIITLGDASYPSTLLDIPDPPAVLFAAGNVGLLNRPALAIVGSRSPSPQGIDNARAFAKALGNAGYIIVSGLALGIDAAAHEGALNSGNSTIAVLGCGINVVYPKTNRVLFERIIAEGLILSEHGLDVPALPAHFPTRNRIISGLSRGCLVIEASLSSGSLITARVAVEQGREVFAVPGSIHSPLSKGCHALIKQGAKLVESANDVLEELGYVDSRIPAPPSGDEMASSPFLDAMGFDPIHLDILCSRLNLTPDVVSAMLLELELEGAVVATTGGRYQRRA
ncbi:MAG: DNA-processing protein DprA [Burkholderiales bacterium]